MKSISLICFFLLFTMIVAPDIFSQDLDDFSLISHYPLSSDANDIKGDNGPMNLMNTPFQDDGIFCNGNYSGGDPNPCDASTPAMANFDFSSFAISATFKIDQNYDSRRPVVVCGKSWRWLSIFIDSDNAVGFAMNDTFTNGSASQTKCDIGKWHVVTATYDSDQGTGELYLDGTLIDSKNEQLNHNNDNVFTITHGGIGSVFRGTLKDLKFYSKSTGGGGGGGCFISIVSE